MNINTKKIYISYLFLYFSILIGFYFNEDFGVGYITDYLQHKNIVASFDENFSKSFLNFDDAEEFGTAHSPIYIIFFLILKKISFNETFARFINLHLSLLIPYFFYLSLKLKYQFKFNDIKILLPTIIFLSPYFRSASIWLGSENISLIFLSICIYYFLKYENSKKKDLSYIILTTLFLALAAYIRPIYSLFSIYFFARFYFDLRFSSKLLSYIFLNLLLSFPAIYYVFILDVNFVSMYISKGTALSNFINQFSITVPILFFYSIPFLLVNFKKNFKKNNFKIENLILSTIFLILLVFYFDYSVPYGGGIFYMLSTFTFKNYYLFYIFSLLSFSVFILIFINSAKSKDRIFDLILILVLILLEIDQVYFHETYDPLLYFVYFLLIKNRIYLSFSEKLTNKKFILLGSFSLSFYVLSVLKTII